MNAAPLRQLAVAGPSDLENASLPEHDCNRSASSLPTDRPAPGTRIMQRRRWLAGAALLALSGAAQAALVDRGGGMIY